MKRLNVGDLAPDFNALDQDGNKIKLKDFTGSKLILFFYPKANTPGCTAEACSLRDYYSDLQSNGFKIVGVSADNTKNQKSFISKYKLPFPLITDTDKRVIQDYGVWGPKKFMGRTFDGIIRKTFVIAEDGKIEKIFDKVNTGEHAEQILNEYKF
jgi:thioredoxin-dependent peroxiredoxin